MSCELSLELAWASWLFLEAGVPFLIGSLPADLEELGLGCSGCVFSCRAGVPFMIGSILVLDLLIIAALAFLPCAHSSSLLVLQCPVPNARDCILPCTIWKIPQQLRAAQQIMLAQA